jgi:prophage regulatory protein
MSANTSCVSAILRRPQVQLRTGLARSTIYELISEGRFPAPIQLTDRTVGWLDREIEDWIASRVMQSRRPSDALRHDAVSP